MTEEILQRLQCPVCGSGMVDGENGKSCFCLGERRHCFDFSKSGYLNLASAKQAGGGDSKEAVRNRSLFLESGYYAPLADAVCRILDERGIGSVLDAGCGEGYYTNRMAKGRTTLGIDLSVCGIDHAAKQAKRDETKAGFAVSSLFSIPVKNGSFEALTSLFAPCAEQEFHRVLQEGGYLLLVGAGERHLMGLKQAVYQHAYENEARCDLPVRLSLLQRERLCYTVTVTGNDAVQALFSMTPYYWRTSEADREKLNGMDSLCTELDFDIFLYRKES